MKASEEIIESILGDFDIPEGAKEIMKERLNNLGHCLISEFLNEQTKDKSQEYSFEVGM